MKEEDLAFNADTNEASCLQGRIYWNPFSLTFLNPSREQWFRRVTYPAWHLQDFCGHCIGLVIAPIMLIEMKESLALWYALMWLFLSYIWAPTHIYTYLKHRETLDATRFWNIVALRIMTSAICTGLGFFVPLPEPSISAVLITMLTKSSAAGMFYTSLVHRLEFHLHVMVQSIAMLIGFVWIPPFCSTCSSDVTVMTQFQKMGYGIDYLFSFGLLKTVPEPMEYSCWMLSVLVMTVFGFILPTVFVFVSEISSRAMFVRSRVSQKLHGDVVDYAQDGMRVGILGGLCVGVGCWFLLHLVSDSRM